MGLLSGRIRDNSAIIPVGVFAAVPTRAAAETPRGKNAYNALIDTGAEMTAVTERVARALSPKYDGEIYYQGVSDAKGQKTTSTYKVCLTIPARNITINIPPGKHIGDAHLESTSVRVHRELTVAGCLSEDKGHDVLLGMDALAGCSLLLQYGGFVLGYPDVPDLPEVLPFPPPTPS